VTGVCVGVGVPQGLDSANTTVSLSSRGSFKPSLYHLSFSHILQTHAKKVKGGPYSIAKRRVPELIPLLCSQPARDVSHKPGCRYYPPGLQLPSQPLRALLPVSLLDEQRHDGCEQFA